MRLCVSAVRVWCPTQPHTCRFVRPLGCAAGPWRGDGSVGVWRWAWWQPQETASRAVLFHTLFWEEEGMGAET